jgi:hypothetical protein
MTTMAIWKHRETKRTKAETVRVESERLKHEMLAKAATLDEFVASLRMEVERTEGASDDRPTLG